MKVMSNSYFLFFFLIILIFSILISSSSNLKNEKSRLKSVIKQMKSDLSIFF